MNRLILTKLMLRPPQDVRIRPRLVSRPRTSIVLVQAPAGAGKTVFLAQWLPTLEGESVYYQLDEHDQDPAVFTSHLVHGFRRCWPEWQPPDEAQTDPEVLATSLVNEAIGRPPVTLALDRLDCAFGQSYLTRFLTILTRYAPPEFTLVLSTRAPLPVELGDDGSVLLITATDLALTQAEAQEWLAMGPWSECHTATGGFPLALRLWKQSPAEWPALLAARFATTPPPHVTPDVTKALTDAWLSGRLSLRSFAHQMAQGQPSAERSQSELLELRYLLTLGEVKSAQERLRRLWDQACAGQDQPLMGATALMIGETYYALGEYQQALAWYDQAFAAAPLLETTGCHSKVAILRDLGHLQEAEALARRCVAAGRVRADLRALTYAYHLLGSVCLDQGNPAEAETCFLEAERLGIQLAGEPFFGILAMASRGVLRLRQGDLTGYRRLAEEAYALARRRSVWMEAICGYILAPALFAWGEPAKAYQLFDQALTVIARVDAKWQLCGLYTLRASLAWAEGRHAEARADFDNALRLAAPEHYVQCLVAEHGLLLTLTLDALARGVEVPFCQEVLVRIGEAARPGLLLLAQHADARVRQAALYPLATLPAADAAASIQVPAPPAATTEVPPTAPLAATLLGAMDVASVGQTVAWRTLKARDLLAYFLLHGDRPVGREQLMEALWPDGDVEATQGLLHTTMYYLRRALRPAGDRIITFTGGVYRLQRDRVALDLDRFYEQAGAGTEEGWRAAAQLYGGDLLQGLDYEWCEAPRARARSTYLTVLDELASHLDRHHRGAEAVACLQELVQADPLAEDPQIRLIQSFAAAGNRSAALQQYRTLARLLDDELGLEPSSAAQALYHSLLE